MWGTPVTFKDGDKLCRMYGGIDHDREFIGTLHCILGPLPPVLWWEDETLMMGTEEEILEYFQKVISMDPEIFLMEILL